MSTINEVADLIEEQGKAALDFRQKQIARIDAIEKSLTDLEKRAGRPFATDASTSTAAKHESWIDVKTKKAVPVLRHDQSLAALETKAAEPRPSIGRVLRGIVLGGTAHDAGELAEERKSMNIFSDTTGGYTVSGSLADTWVDALRANMVLSKAGALTLPMDAGQVTIARVTADPTISWHGESAALSAVTPTFGALTLTAKTCVCLVKLSLELAQDSANIESQLQNVITNAMAAAIDSAGLNGSATDQAAAPGGIFNVSGINALSTVGAPTTWGWVIDAMYELMLDNVRAENIGALVAHPAVWKKMRKLATGISSDNSPLPMPEEVARLPKLWTTAAPFTSGTTCSAMIADWRDLVFGVRKEITVRVLSEAYLGSNLEIAVLAYARVDFGATRPTSFCSAPGITI